MCRVCRRVRAHAGSRPGARRLHAARAIPTKRVYDCGSWLGSGGRGAACLTRRVPSVTTQRGALRGTPGGDTRYTRATRCSRARRALHTVHPTLAGAWPGHTRLGTRVTRFNEAKTIDRRDSDVGAPEARGRERMGRGTACSLFDCQGYGWGRMMLRRRAVASARPTRVNVGCAG